MDKQEKLKKLVLMGKKVKCNGCGKLVDPNALIYSDKCVYCDKQIDEREIDREL